MTPPCCVSGQPHSRHVGARAVTGRPQCGHCSARSEQPLPHCVQEIGGIGARRDERSVPERRLYAQTVPDCFGHGQFVHTLDPDPERPRNAPRSWLLTGTAPARLMRRLKATARNPIANRQVMRPLISAIRVDARLRVVEGWSATTPTRLAFQVDIVSDAESGMSSAAQRQESRPTRRPRTEAHPRPHSAARAGPDHSSIRS